MGAKEEAIEMGKLEIGIVPDPEMKRVMIVMVKMVVRTCVYIYN
jgi:hypothetical protein